MQLGMTKLTDHAPASQEHCWRLGWAIIRSKWSLQWTHFLRKPKISNQSTSSTERAFGSKVTLAPSGGVLEVIEKEKQP
jgi:hypothetical protein